MRVATTNKHANRSHFRWASAELQGDAGEVAASTVQRVLCQTGRPKVGMCLAALRSMHRSNHSIGMPALS